jgi:hypothetical protein
MRSSVERSDVLALLITAAIAFISGYGAFELQEWLRRSRHAEMLKRALRAELERVDRVLGTYVYLWDQASEPTAAVIEELRRLVGPVCSFQTGAWSIDRRVEDVARGGRAPTSILAWERPWGGPDDD